MRIAAWRRRSASNCQEMRCKDRSSLQTLRRRETMTSVRAELIEGRLSDHRGRAEFLIARRVFLAVLVASTRSKASREIPQGTEGVL